MRTSIEIAARRALRNEAWRLAAQKQLGLDQTKSSAVIDRSLEGVISELRKVSANDLKSRGLLSQITAADPSYSVVFPADKKRAAALDSAGKQLEAMIGADGKTRLSKELVKDFNLTQLQANDALGFVTPAVVTAIKTSFADGSVPNSVAGLNTALQTTGTDVTAASPGSKSPVSKSPGSKSTPAATGSASPMPVATGAVAASEPSWLKRYGLAFFLLCGLTLLTIKYCSDTEKSKVVAEERDQLQLNLAGAEEQNAKTSDELVALQGNFDESQSQVDSLTGELQSVQTDFQNLTAEHESLKEEFAVAQDEVELNTAEINLLQADLGASQTELEQLRDLPQDAVGLQQQLIETMAELDIARAAEATALEKLKAAEANLNQTREINESLKFDVDTAQKNIRSNAVTISGFRSQVDKLSAERDNVDAELKTTLASLEDEQADVTRLSAEVRDLEDRIGEMTNKVEELDTEIVTLTELNKDLESDLQTTQASLDSEREGRQSDNSSFTAEAASLQEQLAGLTSQRETFEATLSERDGEITRQAEASDALEQKFGAEQEKVEQLEKERDELLASIDELKKQSESLIGDNNKATSEIESKDKQNEELADQLQTLQAQSDQAEVEIDGLEKANAELTEELTIANALNDNLKASIESLEDTNNKLEQSGIAFRQSLRESEQNMAKLSEARDKLQSEVAATGAEAKALETDANNAREAIREKLTAAGYEDVQVKSTDDNRAVAITLGSSIIFSAGDVAMSRQGSKLLREVGRAISDYPDWHIDVEGHTDSLPIGEQLSVFYPSNWELSSARASAVINHLRFASGLKADLMSARGFADTQPVADNNTVEGREKNRRVDIVLRR